MQLAGLAILGIGIWTKIDAGQFDSFLGDIGSSIPAYMMTAAGGFIAVVGFLGCCGAIKESRCLLGLVSLVTRDDCDVTGILIELRYVFFCFVNVCNVDPV